MEEDIDQREQNDSQQKIDIMRNSSALSQQNSFTLQKEVDPEKELEDMEQQEEYYQKLSLGFYPTHKINTEGQQKIGNYLQEIIDNQISVQNQMLKEATRNSSTKASNHSGNPLKAKQNSIRKVKLNTSRLFENNDTKSPALPLIHRSLSPPFQRIKNEPDKISSGQYQQGTLKNSLEQLTLQYQSQVLNQPNTFLPHRDYTNLKKSFSSRDALMKITFKDHDTSSFSFVKEVSKNQSLENQLNSSTQQINLLTNPSKENFHFGKLIPKTINFNLVKQNQLIAEQFLNVSQYNEQKEIQKLKEQHLKGESKKNNRYQLDYQILFRDDKSSGNEFQHPIQNIVVTPSILDKQKGLQLSSRVIGGLFANNKEMADSYITKSKFLLLKDLVKSSNSNSPKSSVRSFRITDKFKDKLVPNLEIINTPFQNRLDSLSPVNQKLN